MVGILVLDWASMWEEWENFTSRKQPSEVKT